MSYGTNNYFMATKCNWVSCVHPENEADYVSESGSHYWYTDEGVVRMSDHWGSSVASCDWYLDNEIRSSFSDFDETRCGFAKWEDFEPVCELHVCVYGVDEDDSEEHGKHEPTLAIVECTPENMSNGYVSTKWGVCKFDAYRMMAIML